MAARRLVILTNAELGAANVFLATLHALLEQDPALEIHVVSFASLSRAVDAAIALALQTTPSARPPVFHPLPESVPPATAAIRRTYPDLWDRMGARPGWMTGPALARVIAAFFAPWEPAEYAALYTHVRGLMEDLRPDIALLDPLFGPGWTACRELGVPMCHVVPNSLKDAAGPSQPGGAVFWKYPAFASGLPFPLPWYYVPLNIYLSLCIAFYSLFDSRISKVITELESSLQIKPVTGRDLLAGQPPGLKMLIGCRREIDFPLAGIPQDVIPCGPIVRPAPPVRDVDRDLGDWLERGPTVFINLGTLASQTEADAVEMASAVRILLDKGAETARETGELQVLWKLKKSGNFDTGRGSAIHSILGPEMDAGRVRITAWVAPEPLAVLRSGKVVCSVHHGAAGSYNDSICAGVPHVVLPVWADTYDYAFRVEWLGIGLWGSREARPKCKASELGPVLIDVVLGPRAGEMRSKARELASVCEAYGEGRDIAAKQVLGFLTH